MLTLVRQVPQLSISLLLKRDTRKQGQGHYSTILLYSVYLLIWPLSGFYVWRGIAADFWLYVGFVFLVSGILVRLLALRELGRFYSGGIEIQQGHELVRTGIYSLIRHPLHLGLGVELLGMIVISHQLYLSALWLGLLVVVFDRNRKEDAILRVELEEATVYQEQVPGMNIVIGAWRRLRKDS